jgi:hypothetical protein
VEADRQKKNTKRPIPVLRSERKNTKNHHRRARNVLPATVFVDPDADGFLSCCCCFIFSLLLVDLNGLGAMFSFPSSSSLSPLPSFLLLSLAAVAFNVADDPDAVDLPLRARAAFVVVVVVVASVLLLPGFDVLALAAARGNRDFDGCAGAGGASEEALGADFERLGRVGASSTPEVAVVAEPEATRRERRPLGAARGSCSLSSSVLLVVSFAVREGARYSPPRTFLVAAAAARLIGRFPVIPRADSSDIGCSCWSSSSPATGATGVRLRVCRVGGCADFEDTPLSPLPETVVIGVGDSTILDSGSIDINRSPFFLISRSRQGNDGSKTATDGGWNKGTRPSSAAGVAIDFDSTQSDFIPTKDGVTGGATSFFSA